MKELSIEEKAKAYDEAIERGKQIQTTPYTANWDIMKEVAEHLLPELKESEDEKIRKDIVTYLKSAIANKGYRDKIIESWIAWLEKQGEKGTKGNDREIPFDTWSKEDDEHLGRILKELENQRQRPFNRPYLDKIESDYNWLKFLKDRVQPQLKQEWSEEDEKCIRLSTDIIDSSLRAGFCVQLDRDRCVDWLKSLKFRYTWKPSDEQMDMLAKVCSTLHLTSGENEIMESLYDGLKKLRGK